MSTSTHPRCIRRCSLPPPCRWGNRRRVVMTSTRQVGWLTEASVRWRAVLLAAVAAVRGLRSRYELRAKLTLAASPNVAAGIVATSPDRRGLLAALSRRLLIKPLLAHAAIAFIAVEAVLGIIGGLSAAALWRGVRVPGRARRADAVLRWHRPIGGLVGAAGAAADDAVAARRVVGPPMRTQSG